MVSSVSSEAPRLPWEFSNPLPLDSTIKLGLPPFPINDVEENIGHMILVPRRDWPYSGGVRLRL